MAEVQDFKNHSTIQIRKDVYFVFGNLEYDGSKVERIKNSINAFKTYFEAMGMEAPEIKMNWKTAQEGDWVLSDDERIVQILKRTDTKKKNDYNQAIIRTCVATFAVNETTDMDTDFQLHPDRYRISNSNLTNDKRVASRDKPTSNEITFAKRVAMGEQPKEAYMKTYPTENEEYANDMSKVLMRQERIHQSVTQEVDNLLTEEGVSKRYIIRQYKNLIDQGLLNLKDCSGSVRAALKDLADMSAMMPEKNKSSQTQGALKSIGDDKLQEIEEAEYTVEDFKYEDDEFKQEFDKPKNGNGSMLNNVGQDLLS